MTGQVTWTEKSSKNLQSIHKYIANDSPTYATRFLKALIKATRKLETLPQCGRIVPELADSRFREVLYQNYRIVYRINPENEDVEILAVLHGARDLQHALETDWIL